MRLLTVVFALCVAVQVMSPAVQSATPSITLPDIPDISFDDTFYYFRVLTAFVGSRKVRTDDDQPITVRFAIKITIDGERAIIVVRNADNHRDCERLESDKVDHHNDRRRRNHIILHDKIRNGEGQVFNFYWHRDPDDGHHDLHKFNIHTAESTSELPIYFMSLASDNPRDNSPSLQKKIRDEYFRGTGPNCE